MYISVLGVSFCVGSFFSRLVVSFKLPGISSRIGAVSCVRYWSMPCVEEVYVATIGRPAKVFDWGFIFLCVLGKK